MARICHAGAKRLSDGLPSDIGHAELQNLVARSDDILDTLFTLGMSPQLEKRLDKRYRAGRIADLLGCSRTKVRRAVDELGLAQEINLKTGRPAGYTLAQVHRMRDHLKARPGRLAHERCVRLAIQSFKGGSSKSVTTVYLSQYLAERGYRVLVVDCDPQASATSSFGFVPDAVFETRHTLAPFMRGEQMSLDYAVMHTYFDGIDLVPACLALADVDIALFQAVSHADTDDERKAFYRILCEAVDTVEERYDVVLLDSAPALSLMSIGILLAANALLVPVPPALYDFASTGQYLRMVSRVIEGIDASKRFDFVKLMPARIDRAKPKQLEFLEVMADKLGRFMLRESFHVASAIPDTASYYQTVFDQPKPDRRILAMLNQVLGEIEAEIVKCWPSRRAVAEVPRKVQRASL